MKIKFAIIYAVAGVAFLAVSLWVFLSNGKSAKAIRYKYKLGGIMLTAWAMLSAASCTGIPPFVTCYEPAVTCYDVAMEQDLIEVTIKDKSGNSLKCGDVLVFKVQYPSYGCYRCRLYQNVPPAEDGSRPVIQENDCVIENDVLTFEIPIAATDYRGSVQLLIYGLSLNGDGTEHFISDKFLFKLVD